MSRHHEKEYRTRTKPGPDSDVDSDDETKDNGRQLSSLDQLREETNQPTRNLYGGSGLLWSTPPWYGDERNVEERALCWQ